MRITRVEAQALAAFVSRIRDDWDQPGIVAAIEKAAPLGAPAAIGAALCRLAENRDLRTPALLAEPGTHWAGTTVAKLPPPVMCHEHPDQPARACKTCAADAVPAAECPTWQRPTLTRRTRTARRPEPTPADLADVRARADREATT